ncbi:sugar phosphate isomerase/epimerase [Paucibacter sp. R3-3]|uniref:Sugar phosphate isomerase/epimerase n=1 Tax=Roseateles agri TaxID=3098619 RepID=A0ABU5DNR0_9BURK|nr:sugar phosphate isomerase/epimerase [Paucibacter sp. R3-3]MDY0747774.1 sugar phosphate isomerase/epimerase [Paucibacter sp. R3-3]
MSNKPELLAAYWTLAGDVYPGAPTEVSPYSLAERAAAAAKAGYTGMGLVHQDLTHYAQKIGYGGMRQILADNGIAHVEVEFLSDWWLDKSDPLRQASDKARAELMEAAAELKARNFKVSPRLFDETPADVQRMGDDFARLCEQAREVGSNIIMEMMPFTNVRTLDVATGIVAHADQPNGGLLIDIWHVHRGGMSYGEIAKVPARFLKGIELDDANANVVGTLFEDTRFQRRLCGEGVFDVPAFLRAMHAAGFDAPYYGVEIINENFRLQPLDEMAKTSFDSTMRSIELAFSK